MAERTKLTEHLGAGSQQNGTNGAPAPPPPAGEPERQEVTLHEVVEVLFKNKWIILACFVIVLASVAFITLRMEPEYESETTILVNTSESSPALTGVADPSAISRDVSNEIEILKSRRIALLVAEKLLDIEFVPGTDQRLAILGNGKLPSKDALAGWLQSSIEVRPISRNVDIIRLTATSTQPKESALIANLYAANFIEYNRSVSRERVAASREFLNEVTDQFSAELRDAENDLTAFLNQQGAIIPDQEASQLIGRISSLQEQQYQTQLELGMAQAELRALNDQLEDIIPNLSKQLSDGDAQAVEALTQQITQLEIAIDAKYARNPALRQDPSVDRELSNYLKDLEQYKARRNERAVSMIDNVLKSGGADLSSSMGGQDMTGRLQVLADLRQQIMQKQVEVSGLDARMGQFGGQLDQYQGQLGGIPQKDIILSRLERSLQTRESLYLQLINRLQEARIAEQSELGSVAVVDEAVVPRGPVRPKVQVNLLLGAIVGLMLGLGVAFIRNTFDSRIRKPEDLRRRGYNVLGVVPDMQRVIKQDFKGQERVNIDGHDYSTRLISLLNPLSPVAEGYRRLRTNIQYSRPDVETRLIMVTSPNPSEGKTVTAMNLAITMAQAGRRTLFIDADLRRPEGHRIMGLSRDPGLVDLLFDSVAENIEQFATSVDNYLYVLPAGRDVPNPAEVLGSRKMQKFLARWRQEFDVVIVDTPPALVVSDALILTSMCDGTVVVCSANETNWQAVDRTVESLHSVGGELIGIMLNRFDLKAAYGGYKYGYGYGYEYSYYNNYYYGRKSSGGAKQGWLARFGS